MEHAANQTDRVVDTQADSLLHLVAVVRRATSLPHGADSVQAARGTLEAIIERVPIESFLSASAEAGLQDAEVLAQKAAHHDALTRGVDTEAILPIPFGTIFESVETLDAFVSANAYKISAFLDQTANHTEFAIKGLADLKAIARSKEAEEFKAGTSTDVGSAYLNRAKKKAEQVVIAKQDAAAILDELVEPLDLLSSDSADRPVRESMNTDSQTCLFNWAFLVPNAHANLFISKINEINASNMTNHIALAWSGPYPPYSFLPELQSAG